MMLDRAIRATLTILLVVGACLAARNPYFQGISKSEYTFFSTILSATVLLISIRHSVRDLTLLAIFTMALLVIASRPDHFRPGIPLTLSTLGLASLAVLGVLTIWSSHAERAVLLWGFAAGVALVSSGWVLPLFLNWVAKSNPKSFDLYLLSFDASLRFQPSFLLGRAFRQWPVFGKIGVGFYMGIICLCTLVFADHLQRNVKKAAVIFCAFFISSPIGILFYNLFPARGPLYLFGAGFPGHPLPLDAFRHLHLEPVVVHGFPNAMPSLHMTWALLGFWYSRDASWWVRMVASAFLLFTICSTLGTGEHYLVDLVVAVPFTLMIEAICAFFAGWTNPWRIRSAVFGAAAAILWMTFLRFQPSYFWVTPLTPWAMIIATIVATLFLEKRLAEATQTGTERFPLAEMNTDPVATLGSDVRPN